MRFEHNIVYQGDIDSCDGHSLKFPFPINQNLFAQII